VLGCAGLELMALTHGCQLVFPILMFGPRYTNLSTDLEPNGLD